MVEGLAQTKVADVAAGHMHAVVVTAEGRVIKFGHGLVAQLKGSEGEAAPESPFRRTASADWDADSPDGVFRARGNFDLADLSERLRLMEDMPML